MADIDKKHSRAHSLLDSKRIGGAIKLIKESLHHVGLSDALRKAETIEETYRYMTRYLLEGVKDESREKMLSDMREQLRSLNDLALRASRTPDNQEYYYSLLRLNSLRNERLSDILASYGQAYSELSLAEMAGNDTKELRRRCEDSLSKLFDTVFISFGAESDYQELISYLTSGYADNSVAVQALSAMTLSLMYFYDRGKMNTLVAIYRGSTDEAIRARALVGLFIALTAHPARIAEDGTLIDKLRTWGDSDSDLSALKETAKALIGTRDTERVSTKLKDEVIPELMKMRPEIMKTLEKNPEDLEAAMLENNPEWEEMLKKSGLEKKMQELSELQSDGADIMMFTFSNLKQFPFFNRASNWFLPFDLNHTELTLGEKMRKMIEVMASAGPLVCDSDLYSLAIAASKMPEAQINMMTSQLNANLDQLQEEAKSNAPTSSDSIMAKEILRSTRDFYRFFKLFRKREGFFDPFARPVQFASLPVFGDLLRQVDSYELFAEFYFKRGYYSEALPILMQLAESRHDDATLWEKIGFCHQSEGNYLAALEDYEKASLLHTPGSWLTNKLAYVNRKLGNYAAAAEHYSNALEMDPDNVTLIMNAGNMLLETGNVAGALSHFYHALYLRNDNPKVMRAVAWVELLNSHFDKATDYYEKILATDPQPADYLNAGHTAMLRNQPKEALNLYRLAASDSKADFEKAFKADIPTIESLGADATTLLLMLDMTVD